MSTLTILMSCSSAIRSSTGATAWHGPHHSAQKSTITLPSVSSTSESKVALVASTGMKFLSRGEVFEESRVATSGLSSFFPPPQNAQPASIQSKHVHAAAVRARFERARARDPRALGARGHLRQAASQERRQREVVVHR